MELQVFISKTINDILNGLDEVSKSRSKDVILGERKDTSSHIDFDVAVTAENTSSVEGSAKAGISVAGIELLGGKAQGNLEEKNANLSRIKFSVWIQQ